MPQQIPLGKSNFAFVDDDVYDQIKHYNWFLSDTGYAVGFLPVDAKYQLVYLHRYILKAGPGELVDHINGAKSSITGVPTCASRLHNRTTKTDV